MLIKSKQGINPKKPGTTTNFYCLFCGQQGDFRWNSPFGLQERVTLFKERNSSSCVSGCPWSLRPAFLSSCWKSGWCGRPLCHLDFSVEKRRSSVQISEPKKWIWTTPLGNKAYVRDRDCMWAVFSIFSIPNKVTALVYFSKNLQLTRTVNP